MRQATSLEAKVQPPPAVVRPAYFAFICFADEGEDFTGALAHADGDRIVVDKFDRRTPPFNRDAFVANFVNAHLRPHAVKTVWGVQWSSQWSQDALRRHGVELRRMDRSKPDTLAQFLALYHSGKVVMPEDTDELQQQFGELWRTLSSNAGTNANLVAAIAGAAVVASEMQTEIGHAA